MHFACFFFLMVSLLVRLETTVFGVDLCFTAVYLFLFRQSISELRRPIAMKFCSMMGSDFIMPVHNFVGPSPQKNIEAKNMQNLA